MGAGAGLGSCFAVGWVACVSTNTAGALAGESENQSSLAQSSTQPPSPPCPSSAQPALHPAGRGGAVSAEGHHQPQSFLPGPAGRGAAHTGGRLGRMCVQFWWASRHAYRHACKHAQEDWGPDGLAWAVETARFLGSMPMPRSGPPPRPQALACPHASPHSAPLQALTDKLKGMSSELLFATTRHGDLHLQVHTTGEHAAQQPWLGARTRMAVTWWALRLGCLSCKPAYNRGLPPR